MRSLAVICFLIALPAAGQTITTGLPRKINPAEKYLFYFHGGVVTKLGNNAINNAAPEWGPYEYSNILDSLRKRGFNVISEIRKDGVNDSVYIDKLFGHISSLMRGGVPAKNIVVVGASAGSYIVLHAAARLRNDSLKFVIMGGCWPETHKDYAGIVLFGRFLSIIETTDPHGTCYKIFDGRKTIKDFREIKLNMGLSHGFIYKGHKEWIDPIVAWFRETQ
ncbi:MAG TPA: hypothetical protein VEB86_01745 [Chryseosolibacter sp.]|nr:hypothetical protein [Chryseosolibacter sp.]